MKKADHQKGKVPYISSTASSNGVDEFIGNNEGVRIFSDCLSLANSGSVGSCFYPPYEFVESDSILCAFALSKAFVMSCNIQ